MIKASFTKTVRKGLLEKTVNSMIENIEKDFHDRVVDLTPVGKTGNARSGWKRTATGSINDVPYIGVLNKGRVKASHRKGMQGSEQAPKGMTDPALEQIKKQFNKGTYLK